MTGERICTDRACNQPAPHFHGDDREVPLPLCRWYEQPEKAHPTYTQFGTLNCSQFELRPSERVRAIWDDVEIDGDTARLVNPRIEIPAMDYGGREIIVSHPRKFGRNPETVLESTLETLVQELAGLPANDLIMVLRRASYVRNTNAVNGTHPDNGGK